MPDPRDLHAVERDARRLAELALGEDGSRDVTSMACVAADARGMAAIEAREELTFAGRRYAEAVATVCSLPPIEWHAVDGERIDAGQVIGRMRGPLRDILRAERPLLNLLQRATGIATMTRKAVDLTSGTGCVVLHTRKTSPGLRLLEVRAVLDGGGGLHRLDLATTAMIKDNHWQALKAGGRTLEQGIAALRAMGVSEIQVEVESIEQLVQACRAGATRVMIDNQPATTVREWTDRARRDRRDIQVEATGGITLDNIRDYALAGVDFVSAGFLTHSVRSADLGVEIA